MRILHTLYFTMLVLVLQAQEKGIPNDATVNEAISKTFVVDNPDFPTNKDIKYKVVFDVAKSGKTIDDLNQRLVTVMRFYNMHRQAGVPAENLDISVIVHGDATKDVLNSRTYRERYEVRHPNLSLIDQLVEKDINVYLCGQAAAGRNITRPNLAEGVQLALSAMTVLVTLQRAGYAVINFNY
ncbi:MAG: DsrE family protein [Bacteroidota bacterium]